MQRESCDDKGIGVMSLYSQGAPGLLAPVEAKRKAQQGGNQVPHFLGSSLLLVPSSGTKQPKARGQSSPGCQPCKPEMEGEGMRVLSAGVKGDNPAFS